MKEICRDRYKMIGYCIFSGAAITEHDKLSCFKQGKFILQQSGGWKSKIPLLVGWGHPGGCEGPGFHAPPSFCGCRGSWCPLARRGIAAVCFHFHMELCVCVQMPLI